MNRRTILILVLAATAAAMVLPLSLCRESLPARDDRFYPYDPREIRAVDFVYPDRRLRIEFEDGEWMLTAPVRDLTDREAMLRLFGVLQGEVKPPMRAMPGDLGAAGLDRPFFRLLFHREARVDTLDFGSIEEESGKLLTRASWSDSLILAPALIRTHFMRNRYDLSDKRPLPLDRERAVVSILLDNPRGEIAFHPDGEGGWLMSALAEYPADPLLVREILRHAGGPAILGFLDDASGGGAGVTSAPISLEVLQEGDTRPMRLEVGSSFAELYLARSSERPHEFLIDSISVAPLTGSLADYLPRLLFSVLPGRVEWIAGPDWRVEHQSHGEQVWLDQNGRKVELREVSRLIALIADISTRHLESPWPREDQLRDWGLAEGGRAVRFFERGRERVIEMGSVLNGRRYFRRADVPAVYSLPEEELPDIRPLGPALED